MIHFLASAIGALQLLVRVCPRCGHKQLAPVSQRTVSVVCKNCGEEISATLNPYPSEES